MLKKILIVSLSLLVLFGNGSGQLLSGLVQNSPDSNNGTLEKMIVATGNVAMDLNLNLLNGKRVGTKVPITSELRFDAEPNSFFKVLVFNNELRGPLPGSLGLVPQNSAALPAKLNASYQQLVVESMEWGEAFDLTVRDGKTGFNFFNIEGQEFDYDSIGKVLSIKSGRLLLSKEFAAELGRPSNAGTVVGKISITATMRPIEITQYVNGEATSDTMPPLGNPLTGTTPGPDVVVGDVSGLAVFGTSATQVGLSLGTDSCNFGVENLHWFQLPDNDHPTIPQNIYRMSGGATNDQTFEQIGQSQVKHAFTALTNNICGLGCNGVGGPNLGSGCSDPYSASLNAGPSLGSKAWINPFTGFYPRGDSGATNPNNHSGHTHTGPGHRMLTDNTDLNTTLNPGATYYAEGQYITPHEFAWCQTHPGQCNMYNNVSYRRYSVTGTTSFTFAPVGSTVRQRAAITAWTGATLVNFEPAPLADGVGTVAYKVTNPSPGVWHYEYAIYNQNLDRAIQSFGVPAGAGVTLSNIGFHAPPQHPGSTFDGTFNNAGFSSVPWTQTQADGMMTWNSETFAQNQNANAIRWGTLYNFRFDSNRPPQTTNATIGFYKTGAPINVQVQAPTPLANLSVSGRIMTSAGTGIANAIVTMTDAANNVRTFYTGSFGYYNFDNVAQGGTYTIAVRAKRYTFTSQVMQVNTNLTDVNFVSIENP